MCVGIYVSEGDEFMNWVLVSLIILYFISILVMVSIIFVRRENTGSTVSWLIIITFLPYVGLIAYFLFGSTYKIKIISRRCRLPKIEKMYAEYVGTHIENLLNDEVEFADSKTEEYIDMIKMNANSALSIYTGDNTVELLTSAQQKYERLFEDIENAKETINVLYFIFKSKDKCGKELISLLAKKAKQGIEVKLIYDRFGDWKKTRYRDFKELVDAGGKVFRYLPQFIQSALSANYRMHRKIVTIDGRIAYTGGINIGDDYLGLDPKIHPWRDTSIRLTGSCVLTLQLRFLYDLIFIEMQKRGNKGLLPEMKELIFYQKLFIPKGTLKGTAGVQIVASGPDTERAHIKDGYVKIINSAKNYLYIQTPYFAPDDTLIDCLIMSANSGVDVRVMIPGVPDKKYIHYITFSNVEQLLEEGIKVYVYNGFLHSKTMVIDDHVATVGTTNLDIRSFSLNYEVNAFVYDTKFALANREVFEKDMEKCKELNYTTFRKRGYWQKFCERICSLFTPLA
jgi:cardiolipin synthase